MHWIPHSYALPSPGKGRKGYLAADTRRGVLETPELSVEQKNIELEERSIALLVSKKTEETPKSRRSSVGSARKSEGKTAGSPERKADPGSKKKPAESGDGNEGGAPLLHDHKA